MEIEKYLLEKGIKPHYKGFMPLTYAIELCQKDDKYLQGFTKWLYPDIANDLGLRETTVEKRMRNAIRLSGLNQSISEFIWRSIVEMRLQKLQEETKNGI